MNSDLPPTSERKPIPANVRRKVMARAQYCCEDCGRKVPLELHHLTYTFVDQYHVAEAIFGYETAEDLDALCRGCHHQRHRDILGDFWVDPEEMADHWWYYHEQMDKD